MSELVLFWHRRDLRIADNVGLAAARRQSPKVVGVFCLDPNLLERDDVAPARVTYMIGCLQALQQRYIQAGSQLLILHNDPCKALPMLATALKAKAVFRNWDVEPYAKERDRAVTTALKEQGIQVDNFWDQLLHAPEEICTNSGEPYTVYTPFWRNWSGQPKADPVQSLQDATGLNPKEQKAAQKAGAIALPTAEDLGFVWKNQLLLEPGESAAQARLEEFCHRAIKEYREQRDFPATSGTSHLSAALKFGAIGIRTVWAAADQVFQQSRSDETRGNVKVWQQELAWREFYQHVMYFFPELAGGPYRKALKGFPWENNQEHFQAWCEGRTGYPIVDAAMRQLNEIGWMHNRCRMIVASFLTKDLLINWQWGEKYFMQKLYDGDLSANNGGWQWSASSGMDPKPLRIFNPASQAKKFDPEAEYIRHWLPELRSIETEALVSGKIPEEECVGVASLPSETLAARQRLCQCERNENRRNYPSPIVDHNHQQRRFKELYQQQKQRKP